MIKRPTQLPEDKEKGEVKEMILPYINSTEKIFFNSVVDATRLRMPTEAIPLFFIPLPLDLLLYSG